MDRKLRSAHDRHLRVTIDKENFKNKSRKSSQQVDDDTPALERELHNLRQAIKETDSKLKSSVGPKSYDDKLSKAMEKRSIREGNEDPSSDLDLAERWFGGGKKIHLLFEFARGYALFYAHNFHEVDVLKFESAEKYINPPSNLPSPLILEAFHPFSSINEALVEMNAISESTMTEQLKGFLLKNLPEGIDGKSNDVVATSSSCLAYDMFHSTRFKFSFTSGARVRDVMRALRMNISKFIKDLHPGDLVEAQLNLARLYNKQRSTTATYVGNSTVVPSPLQFAVVPHRFEGLLIAKGAKGTKDILYTRNLVFGDALPGENLISNEDGTKLEYRVWNPNKSRLAAAILCGVTDIWVKPRSHVLYLGDVHGITVFSDLVGSDGLVYVAGLCDNIVNIAGKRSNIIPIFENPKLCLKYRMVVGMVDVIFADMAASHEVNHIVLNAEMYLKTGGHYIIAEQASNTELTSQDLFADHRQWRREFKKIERITFKSNREHMS